MEKYLEIISNGLYSYRKGKLFIEDVDVEKLVSMFGTPLYVYSCSLIQNQIKKIRDSFKNVSPLICYSMKANSNLKILKLVHKSGCGVDIVSGGELARALKAGFKGNSIVFAGVGKTANEIVEAIKANIYFFTVESIEELKTIDKIAGNLKSKVNCCLRINLDVDVDTHHYTKTAKKETKFGLSPQQVSSVIRHQRDFKNLKLAGIQFHLGSNIKISSPYIEALKRLKTFLDDTGFKPQIIDIGGGFGIPYRIENIEPIEVFGERISDFFVKNFPSVSMVIEPGRFIVGNAGVLLTRIIYKKKTEAKKFLIVDAGMNDLIRPALYNSYHEIIPAVVYKGMNETYDIVGPICETGDFLGKERSLSANLDAGDVLAVMSAGAYGFSMSSNYNGRPRPAEIMVSGKKVIVCRKRENISDLWKHEM